jgi:hypothetical protein
LLVSRQRKVIKLNAGQRARAGLLGIATALTDRALATQCFTAALFGTWEGGEQSRMRDRPGRRLAGQDTDLNYGERENLLSEARALEQTHPITKRIKNQYASYCVGRCRIRWNTGDDVIDKIYRENWDNWMNMCDFRAQHRFPKLMNLAAGQAFAEGDMFVQQIESNTMAQINLIECDRVSSSGIFNFDSFFAGEKSMVGGIGLDSNGRKTFIRVWQRTMFGTFVEPMEIPASEFKHLFDPARVDAYRGVTGFHAVLNALRDVKEIDDAQRAKTKMRSKLSLLVKSITGQPNGSNIRLIDDGPADTVVHSPGVATERVDDATTAYIFNSDEMKMFESNDPGTAWEQHMEFLVRLIAIGANLPFGVVWNMAGLGKPGVLFELRQAEKTISGFQEEIETRLIRPIAGWVTAKDIKYNRIPFHPLWYKFQIARPSYLSIDAGRDSAAAINENKMAMKSLRSWYDETEDDWQDEVTQCATERKYLETVCAQLGVDPNNVRMMQANVATASGGLGGGPVGQMAGSE